MFNTWIDSVQKALGTPSLAAQKLDVSAAVTPVQIPAQLARLDTLLDGVPCGAGYRSGGAVTGVLDDSMLTGTGASNFSLSFLGTLAKITLVPGTIAETFPQTVDPSHASYSFAARLSASGVGAQVPALLPAGTTPQAATDALISQLMNSGFSSGTPTGADCIFQIVATAYGMIVSVAQAVLSDHSLVGTAVAGSVALAMLDAAIAAITACGSTEQKKILASVKCDIDYLRSTHLYGGNSVTLRNLPVVNPPAIETDQIRDTALLCTNMLCYPVSANAGWNGTPKDGTINLFRQILAGLTPATGAPRTFANAEVSAAGLIYDLLFRHPALLKPDFLTSGQFIFCTANFARILRRSPGVTNAQLPSITAAALLCSAPNFAPARSGGPMDLSTIASLPALTGATTLVPGVPIHAQ